MTQGSSGKNFKSWLLFMAGAFVLILGIALILSWWTYVVVVFRGIVGIGLALIGLLLLYMAKN